MRPPMRASISSIRPKSTRPRSASSRVMPEHQVVGVVFAQRVVEDVGGEGGLPPGLAAALVGALDQARDDGGGAEGALHHRVAAEPALQPVAQAVGVEERRGIGDGVEAPDQGGIVGGDEAERGETRLPPSAWSAAGRASAGRCARRSRRRRGARARRRGSFRPAGGRVRAGARPRAAGRATRAVWAGRSGQAGCWNMSRMRWVSRVEVANLVPMKTAILGSRPGWRGDLDGHFAQAFVANDLRRRSGRCRRG